MVVMTDGVGTGGGYKVTLMTAFLFYEDDILIFIERIGQKVKNTYNFECHDEEFVSCGRWKTVQVYFLFFCT